MRNKGFTLIELVLVIVIAAILLAVAVPWFSNYLDYKALQTAMRQVEADLRNAQQKSKAASVPYKVELAPGNTFYKIWAAPPGQAEQLIETKELPQGVKVSGNTATDYKIVYYQPTYTSETNGGVITFISPKGRTGQLTVTPTTGKISLSP
ncbi:MAG: prepilin-type N-terminal cleavage/methylation domain-containing protein [Caldiserica bacterium]|jgi:prepilin-type N-terminal cleavage/methylation domain-containing protein|nr:prepilin-type N-terminal cleavage/methylation domain-containing protein [Caldisericota bacterium]